MRPAPPVATRLSLLGCVLAMVAALALPACGDSGSAAAGGSTSAPPEPPVRANTKDQGNPSHACPAKLDGFVDALDRLRRQLAVGLSYEQYAARIKRLRASYGAIPVDHLAFDCLRATGTPAEHALNKYIDAANAWGECLADASCTTATIEPVLQRKWRAASRFLSAAK